jgi:mannan endo-1,4-beta-mannosidase
MTEQTLGRSAFICTLLATLAACGGSNGATSSASNADPSSSSSTSSGAPAVALSASTYVVPKSATTAVVTVDRIGGTAGAASASYTTVNGTAVAGADYSPTAGTLTWADGDGAPQTIAVPVTAQAAGKNFSVALTAVGGAAIFGSPNSATVSVGGSTAATATASASGSMIPSKTEIFDSALNTWTVSGGVVYENGTAVGYSSNVALLLYYNGTIYQENKTCLWWSWSGSAWVATSNPAPALTPSCASTAASATASSVSGSAATLLSYLKSLSGQSRHVLSGQHSSYWDANFLDFVQTATNQTGKTVAILGTTTGMVGSTENGVALSNAWLAQGGIVEVSWWPQDPITGSWHETSPMSAANFASLTQPGSAGYIAWHKLLDAQIAQLKQINGPVIYRPMLEMNGNWSWWQNQTPATYALLWQQMHDYFVANGVTNVLWFFCPNDGKGNYLTYYAGAEYVDIVGMDVYSNTPTHDMTVDGGYAQLTGTGKPFMIGEAGIGNGNNSSISLDMGNNETYTQQIEQGAPLVVGIVFFCQHWAISVQEGAAALMNDPTVIAMNELPSGIVSP